MGKKIIVIEDDADILDMIAFILEDEGYQVLPSLTAEPLKDIETYKPDLILLDDWLKDGYGHKLCEAVKSNPHTSQIPVLLISSIQNLKEVALSCKADGFIHKPFDIEYLITMVKSYLTTTAA